MGLDITAIVLIVMTLLGVAVYEQPPCNEYLHCGECVDQPLLW